MTGARRGAGGGEWRGEWKYTLGEMVYLLRVSDAYQRLGGVPCGGISWYHDIMFNGGLVSDLTTPQFML